MYSFEHITEFLPEDGAISAETCRGILIIIVYFIVYVRFVGVLKI